jgi:hypothetical protein
MRELVAMAGCGHSAQCEAARRRLWPYLKDHRLARRRALLGAAQQAFDDEAIVLDDFAQQPDVPVSSARGESSTSTRKLA